MKIFKVSDLLATGIVGTPGDNQRIGARRVDALVDIADDLLMHGFVDRLLRSPLGGIPRPRHPHPPPPPDLKHLKTTNVGETTKRTENETGPRGDGRCRANLDIIAICTATAQAESSNVAGDAAAADVPVTTAAPAADRRIDLQRIHLNGDVPSSADSTRRSAPSTTTGTITPAQQPKPPTSSTPTLDTKSSASSGADGVDAGTGRCGEQADDHQAGAAVTWCSPEGPLPAPVGHPRARRTLAWV